MKRRVLIEQDEEGVFVAEKPSLPVAPDESEPSRIEEGITSSEGEDVSDLVAYSQRRSQRVLSFTEVVEDLRRRGRF